MMFVINLCYIVRSTIHIFTYLQKYFLPYLRLVSLTGESYTNLYLTFMQQLFENIYIYLSTLRIKYKYI